MKFLKLAILSCLFVLMPVQNSRAAIAGVAAIAGAPAASGIALAGLGSAGVGYIATMSASSCDGGVCVVYLALGLTVGLVLLDDDSQTIHFSEVDFETANKLGLSTSEIEIYNSEIDEANLVFSEVQSLLDGSSTVDDAKNIWEENQDLLSAETFKVMTILSSQR